MPLLAVPAVFRSADTPARHDSACHFAEEKRVVPPEGEREGPSPDAPGRGGPAVEDLPGPGEPRPGRPPEEDGTPSQQEDGTP